MLIRQTAGVAAAITERVHVRIYTGDHALAYVYSPYSHKQVQQKVLAKFWTSFTFLWHFRQWVSLIGSRRKLAMAQVLFEKQNCIFCNSKSPPQYFPYILISKSLIGLELKLAITGSLRHESVADFEVRWESRYITCNSK